jgi:hypothetical protein
MFNQPLTKYVLAILFILFIAMTLIDLARVMFSHQQCAEKTMNGMSIELEWFQVKNNNFTVLYPGFQFDEFTGKLLPDGTFEVVRPNSSDLWSFEKGIIMIPILLESNSEGTFLDHWFVKNCEGQLYYANVEGIEVLPLPPVIGQSEV